MRACSSQDMQTELTMRGLTDDKQAELAASLAEPFRQPASRGAQDQRQQQQQHQHQGPDDVAVGASDPSVQGSEPSFELNPQRFDSESGSQMPDPDLGSLRGQSVKHDSPSDVSRNEVMQHVDSNLQGSLRATL